MKHPSWLPSNIRFAVREACADNDGYWIYLHDEFEVDNGSTVSGDTKEEAISCFHGGYWNDALTLEWKDRASERAKAAALRLAKKEALLPMVLGKRLDGVTDAVWNRYLAKVEDYNKAVVKVNRANMDNPH